MNEQLFALENIKVWIPGCHGMVGLALARRLQSENVSVIATTRQDVDLMDAEAVKGFYLKNKPDLVFLSAAKVGGIGANQAYPADFIGQNLCIQYNVIHFAKVFEVKKLIFLGSSCVYPKACPQPIQEASLLSGPLEPTNEWYAIAKIAGIKMCQAYRRQFSCDFISLMPINLYGPHDNFDQELGHLPAALLARFHEAKVAGAEHVKVWGTGRPYREFMYVDDLADACVFAAKYYSEEMPLNIGSGDELSIAEFAEKIKTVVGYEGRLEFDHSRPDGTYRKVLDHARLHALGWRPRVPLSIGLKQYYQWYLDKECADEQKC